MLTPEEEIIPPMPLRLSELTVLMRCLMTALKSTSPGNWRSALTVLQSGRARRGTKLGSDRGLAIMRRSMVEQSGRDVAEKAMRTAPVVVQRALATGGWDGAVRRIILQ